MIRRYIRPLTALALVSLIIGSSSGCAVNILALPYFLFGGELREKPPLQLCNGRNDEKKVLVLVHADQNILWGYQSVDDELTGLLISELDAGDKRLELVPERTVREWKDRTTGWSDKSRQSIGEHFDVNYVVWVEITSFSLNTTRNQFLLQGHCDILVDVWDVNKERKVFSDVFVRDFPSSRQVELQDVSSEQEFRRGFLRRISEELSWYMVPHRAADEVEDL